MKRRVLLIALTALFAGCMLGACGTVDTVERERTPLDAPKELTTDGSALTWAAVENAVSYDVEYFCAETDEETVLTGSTQTTSFELSVDRPGQWAARVRARAASNSFYGRSVWTDWLDFRTSVGFDLAVPGGLDSVKSVVSWTPVLNAVAYEVEVNGDSVGKTEKASYAIASSVPGAKYSVRVRALGDEYYADSAWSTEYSFTYAVQFLAPVVSYDRCGAIRWERAEDLYDGYRVTVRDVLNARSVEYKVAHENFDVTALAQGVYRISVRVNGGVPEYDSPESNEVSLSVSTLASWDAAALVTDFYDWNYCQATLQGSGGDAYASLRCALGWGGIILRNALTVDFDRNPVFAVDYGEVPYGYMGNFYFGANSEKLYSYAPDIVGGSADFTRLYRMDKDGNDQAIPEARGVVENVRVSVGFTFAPNGSADREVMQVKRARIVYIEDAPAVPEAPEKLDAPTELVFRGLTIGWKGEFQTLFTPVYRVEIFCDGTSVQVLDRYDENSFDLNDLDGGFRYGKTYFFRVKALGDGIYYSDSDEAESDEFTIDVNTAPTGLRYDTDGYAYWDEGVYAGVGYTVSVQSGSAPATEYDVTEEKFDLTTLSSGDYKLKVKVKGASPEYDSEYSGEITFRITVVNTWDSDSLVSDFTSLNYCSAVKEQNGGDSYASMRCGLGWGGLLLANPLEINFDRNPVFVVDYKDIPFGYMGNFYLGDALYVYAPDIMGPFSDLVRHYKMTEDSNGTISSASGVRSDVRVLIGFTHAPDRAGSDREVMQVRYAKIVYIEDVPVVPDVAEPLTAPQNLNFDGYFASWSAVKGNSDYAPVYTVEIFHDAGSGLQKVKTLTNYAYTSYDLRLLDTGVQSGGRYAFRVRALGDGDYFSDSPWSQQSNAVRFTVTAIDLIDFAQNAGPGGDRTPGVRYEDGKIIMTQTERWGMLRYDITTPLDVQNTWFVVDFESITGGNYYIRLPLTEIGNANDTNSILTGDSAVTGVFSRRLTEVNMLKNLSGEQTVSLHMGLSGNNMTCVIRSIEFVTITNA